MGSYFLPVKIQPGQIQSNIGLDADAEVFGDKWKGVWASGTTYAADDVVRKGYELYISGKDNNSGNDPETTSKGKGAPWVHRGKINCLRMFDEYIGSDTISASTDLVTTISNLKADQLALFNVFARLIRVEILDSSGNVRWIYEKGISTGRKVVGWYDYFFRPFPPRPVIDHIISLPWMIRGYGNEKVRLTLIAGNEGGVACGSCDFGIKTELGITQWDAKSGGMYFGMRKRDNWGRVFRRKGATAKLLKCELRVPKGSENYASRILSGLLDETVIFDLNNTSDKKYEPLIVKGFLTDYWESLKGPNHTTVSMNIEGLI